MHPEFQKKSSGDYTPGSALKMGRTPGREGWERNRKGGEREEYSEGLVRPLKNPESAAAQVYGPLREHTVKFEP